MHRLLYFTPIIPAVICWILSKLFLKYLFRPLTPIKVLGLKFQGLLPRYKRQLTVSFAREITNEITSAEFLQQNLANAETLQRARPLIEAHIDNFLQYKLKTALPVVGMFIGEKITAQLKELFMKELEELFPSVMSQFIEGLSHSDNLQNEIVVKLSGIQIETLEEKFNKAFRKDLLKYEFLFSFVGLMAGVIQLIVMIASS